MLLEFIHTFFDGRDSREFSHHERNSIGFFWIKHLSWFFFHFLVSSNNSSFLLLLLCSLYSKLGFQIREIEGKFDDLEANKLVFVLANVAVIS
jgi:hypothetical protein